MFEIIQSETFREWRSKLKDRLAVLRINARIERMVDGNFGDIRSVGGGVSELRIDYGPGYRVYFTRRGKTVIILLAGGDKHSQKTDIVHAIGMAKAIED